MPSNNVPDPPPEPSGSPRLPVVPGAQSSINGSLPVLPGNGERGVVSAGFGVDECAAAIRAWAGKLATIDIQTEATHVLETLIGDPREKEEGRGSHTDLALQFQARISTPGRMFGLAFPFLPGRDVMTVAFKAPTISSGRKPGLDFSVGVNGTPGVGSYEQFPNDARGDIRRDGELTGMARAAAYFKGAVIGGFVASRPDGILALKECWTCPPTDAPSAVGAVPDRLVLRSIASQLVGFGGQERDLESAPHKDYRAQVMLPLSVVDDRPRTIVCNDGHVGIKATLSYRGARTVQLLLDSASGRVTLSTEARGQLFEHLVEQCLVPSDFVPFAKGFLEGYRVGTFRISR